MLAVFPPLYTLAYASQTAYFKGNNFLPVVPFTAISAAWATMALWRRLSRRLPLVATRPAALAGGLALVALVAPMGFSYVYRSLTPSTLDVAHVAVERGWPSKLARLAHVEASAPVLPAWEGARPYFAKGLSAAPLNGSLEELGAEALALADAEVFPARRLEGRQADFYRARLAASERVERLDPRPFGLRGEPLVVLLHPWRLQRGPEHLTIKSCRERRGCFQLPMRTAAGASVASVVLWIPQDMMSRSADWMELEVGKQRIPLHWASHQGDGHLLISSRFRLAPGSDEARLRLMPAEYAGARPAADLYVWEPPRSEASARR